MRQERGHTYTAVFRRLWSLDSNSYAETLYVRVCIHTYPDITFSSLGWYDGYDTLLLYDSIVDADGSPSGSPRVEVAFRLGTANNFALGRRFREDRSELQRGGKHQNKCYWRARCGETNELYVRIHIILIVTLRRSTVASGARGAYDWYTLPRENETLKILEATRTIFRRKNIPGIYIYLSFLMARNTARGVWFLLGFSLYLFLLEMNGST